MEHTSSNNQGSRFGNWLKTSITARMLMVGLLIVVLLIPLAYIKSLIAERAGRQQEVITEINEKWGEEVLIYGPILKVPYKTYVETTYTDQETKKVHTERKEKIKYGYFFPESLDIMGSVHPEPKSRGIYTTAVYQSESTLTGTFANLDFTEESVAAEDIVWDKARMIIKTSNLKGVNDEVAVNINANRYPFSSVYEGNKNQNNYYNPDFVQMHTLRSIALKEADSPKERSIRFSIDLNVNGSKQIRFIPIGKETTANLTSNWKTANFIGEFLPVNPDKITDEGFNAKWKVLDLNRPFAQQTFNYLPDLNEYASGVNFMIPVDEYQKSERSAKYGFLVIALTFLIFFLIQTLSKISIHPFQYLMIGLALTMFYTLLISISEHSSFLKAYLIAGVAVILLITLYSRSILKNIKFPMFILVSLSALYAFIFTIIQLESYALLVGSLGLFFILAIVMYVSRKIDWQNG
ncbi:cell envelope integrity protein CreD [Spongiivirga sp. MCCC 1A20706]|uniref:cell envelope integrity protein CreD n=1 Tax=Spongiivirga sp. MCCC 1A20706 TaxID=3160963 RepID=UPI0039777E59